MLSLFNYTILHSVCAAAADGAVSGVMAARMREDCLCVYCDICCACPQHIYVYLLQVRTTRARVRGLTSRITNMIKGYPGEPSEKGGRICVAAPAGEHSVTACACLWDTCFHDFAAMVQGPEKAHCGAMVLCKQQLHSAVAVAVCCVSLSDKGLSTRSVNIPVHSCCVAKAVTVTARVVRNTALHHIMTAMHVRDAGCAVHV